MKADEVALHFFCYQWFYQNGLKFFKFHNKQVPYRTDLDNYWFEYFFLNLYISNPNSLPV